ncbi:MAG TPA: hypothetical protein VIO36_05880 [Anaerolineaceae bacterium]
MTTGAYSLFTPKHKRLLRIATAANIFAWISLGYCLLVQFSTIFTRIYISQTIQQPVATDITQWIATLGDFEWIVRGVVYWIILRAAALCLSMVVETDWNYRVPLKENGNG